MRILIIEDDIDLRTSLKSFFEAEFFVVDGAGTATKGLQLSKIYNYDIIILDYLLPDGDGNTICRELRARNIMTPILALSGVFDVDAKITLFNSGIDDYMIKPYSVRELYARVSALIRRPKEIIPTKFTVGPFVFDFTNHLVCKGPTRITLTRKEFCLLEYFIRNKDRVISRMELLDHVWETDADVFSNTVETHIFNLRRKLFHKESPIIQTISGKGYRLIVE